MTRAYLCGPDVFRQNPKEYSDVMKKVCSAFGLEGVFPLDADLNIDKDEMPDSSAYRIFAANCHLIDSCDIVIANMVRFRGVSMDVGTAFEMGYAWAKGKAIYGYGCDLDQYTTVVKKQGLSVKDLEYPNIENFGLQDNLMVSCAVNGYANSFMEAVALAAERSRK